MIKERKIGNKMATDVICKQWYASSNHWLRTIVNHGPLILPENLDQVTSPAQKGQGHESTIPLISEGNDTASTPTRSCLLYRVGWTLDT